MIGDKEGSVVGVVNVGDLVGSLVVGTSDGGKLNVGVVAHNKQRGLNFKMKIFFI